MKFLILFALVALLAGSHAHLTDEQKVLAAQYALECKGQHPISDEQIEKLKSGDLDDASDEAKCFTNCFMEKSGILSGGVVSESAALSKFGPTLGEERVKQLVSACGGEKGSDNCDTAFRIASCLKKNKVTLE